MSYLVARLLSRSNGLFSCRSTKLPKSRHKITRKLSLPSKFSHHHHRSYHFSSRTSIKSWAIGGPDYYPEWEPQRDHTSEVLVVGALVVGGLAYHYFTSPVVEVPFTNRKRRQLIPPEWAAWIGRSLADALIEENIDSILPDNHPLVRMIVSVGNVLTDANGLPRHKYIVVDSEEVNAFVVGGNIVFVYTGILPIFENVSGTAMVLGHEMGHVIAGHSADGILSALSTLVLTLVLSTIGTDSSIATDLWDLVFSLPKQRSAELEADTIGFHLMANAGFDKREAVNVYERMMLATGETDQQPGQDIASTHPIWPTRIGLLTECLDNAETDIKWIKLTPPPEEEEEDEEFIVDEESSIFSTFRSFTSFPKLMFSKPTL